MDHLEIAGGGALDREIVERAGRRLQDFDERAVARLANAFAGPRRRIQPGVPVFWKAASIAFAWGAIRAFSASARAQSAAMAELSAPADGTSASAGLAAASAPAAAALDSI